MKKLIVLAIALMPMVSFSNTDLNVQSDVQTEVDDKRKRSRRRFKRKHGAPKSRCTKRIRVR